MSELDGYSFRDYGAMVVDAARTRPLVAALERAVKPGDVVLDIGTGSGLFAMLACRFGAARVYALEPDDSIEAARLCASSLPGNERIQWIRGVSTDITLPEQVDVVIGDLHGVLPFYRSNIASLIDARERHLKPGGTMIPQRDTLWLAPAHAPLEYACLDMPWEQNEYGLDLRQARRFVANDCWRARAGVVDPSDLLALPSCWFTLDYRTTQSLNGEGQLDWVFDRGGLMHGYYCWFDCEAAEGLVCSNAPTLPEVIYGRCFFPLERAVQVLPGDRLHAHVSATMVAGRYILRWDTDLVRTNGKAEGKFRQSTFGSQPVFKSELARCAPQHAPELTEAGRIQLDILTAMREGITLEEIASRISTRHPGKFPSAQGALQRVAELSLKFGRPPGD